jgi:uncharacterized pyridoxal phosphate-containing UPF0001 family protein
LAVQKRHLSAIFRFENIRSYLRVASELRYLQKLLDCKKDIVTKLGLDDSKVELSMGMSHDFEQAIAMGATNVRVGSSIFGARPAKH